MKIIVTFCVLLVSAGALVAAPDAELTSIIEENRGTSAKLIAYADQKATALVAAQVDLARVKQQLAAAQAQIATLTTERDAALKAKTDAKATVTTAQQQLAAAAAKL